MEYYGRLLGQARKGQTTTRKKKYHGVEGPRDYRDRLKRSKHTEEEEEEGGERATGRKRKNLRDRTKDISLFTYLSPCANPYLAE